MERLSCMVYQSENLIMKRLFSRVYKFVKFVWQGDQSETFILQGV
jgi:hypothetical protein